MSNESGNIIRNTMMDSYDCVIASIGIEQMMCMEEKSTKR